MRVLRRLAALGALLGLAGLASAQVLTGIDVLEQEHFQPLATISARHGGHLRIGLLTNQTGIDRAGRRTADVLHTDAAQAVPGLSLVALFSPEHGINGALDREGIRDTKDTLTGLPVYSLYGAKPADRRPTPEQMAAVDLLVVDLQDAGVRFYTYETVVGYFVEAAAKFNKELVILDRPNPIGGLAVQGPLTTPGRESYVSYLAEPVRHGMTLGELARFTNGEKNLRAPLTVVPMKGWRRSMWFDQTGLTWVDPSPNLRSLAETTVYPGTGLIDVPNLSVGRGTDTPFLRIGAPWIHGPDLARALNQRQIHGIHFVPVTFTPGGDMYPFHGQICGGVDLVVIDRDALNSPEMGLEIAAALWKLYPKDFPPEKLDRLVLNAEVIRQLRSGADPHTITDKELPELKSFQERRAKFLLYQ